MMVVMVVVVVVRVLSLSRWVGFLCHWAREDGPGLRVARTGSGQRSPPELARWAHRWRVDWSVGRGWITRRGTCCSWMLVGGRTRQACEARRRGNHSRIETIGAIAQTRAVAAPAQELVVRRGMAAVDSVCKASSLGSSSSGCGGCLSRIAAVEECLAVEVDRFGSVDVEVDGDPRLRVRHDVLWDGRRLDAGLDRPRVRSRAEGGFDLVEARDELGV